MGVRVAWRFPDGKILAILHHKLNTGRSLPILPAVPPVLSPWPFLVSLDVAVSFEPHGLLEIDAANPHPSRNDAGTLFLVVADALSHNFPCAELVHLRRFAAEFAPLRAREMVKGCFENMSQL